MLIIINRENIYKQLGLINKSEKTTVTQNNKKQILDLVKDKIIYETESVDEKYIKFLEYSKVNNHKSKDGDVESRKDRYDDDVGFFSKRQFIGILSEMIADVIFSEIQICFNEGTKDEKGLYYIPVDHKINYFEAVSGIYRKGRLAIIPFDWSYDKDFGYDYDFELWMAI